MSLFDNIPEGTDIIEVRKKVNKMLSEARKKAKPPKCILCGKEQSSFCNSHSVPQMCLRPIADRGKVLHASLAMGFDIGVVDLDGGVNKSGTFNYICRECDAKFFQDYENPDNIIHPPTDKFLAEIAVKNMLLQLSKRANEQELIPVLQRELGMYENPDDLSKIKTLDQKEYEEEDVYLSNVFDAIDKMYPEVGENINILREKFEKLNNYYMEVILSDGTSLNLYKAIEDVMYGLYLHADPDKIERLLKTNKNVYLMAVKEYITVLEGIVVDTYNSIADKM